jgi:hypothetical protein
MTGANTRTPMSYTLLASGLLFPLISWITFLLSVWTARAGRHSSGVYVPFVGPVLLDVWLAGAAAPGWSLILPWILDIGTLFFFAWLPRLGKELWETSRFTRVITLNGAQGNQTAEFSFHRGGNYQLWIRWQRAPGELGLLAVGDPGTFVKRDRQLELISHTGRERALVATGDAYVVNDTGPQDHYHLQGWHLQ